MLSWTCTINAKKNRHGSKDGEKFPPLNNEQESCWLVIVFLSTSLFLGSFPSTLGGNMGGFDFAVREGILEITFLDPPEAFAEESLMTSSKSRYFTLALLTDGFLLLAHELNSWFTLWGEVESCLGWQVSQSQSLGIIVVLIWMQ